jgi:envelope integrity protein B
VLAQAWARFGCRIPRGLYLAQIIYLACPVRREEVAAMKVSVAVSIILASCAAMWGDGRRAEAAPLADRVFLAPHRAIYDLKLAGSRGTRGIEGVRGRILYDFSGSACEGYQLEFRQVSELDSGEGKAALSDLRSTTWEDGDGKKFRFNSENLFNERRTDIVDGHADRNEKTVAVSLSKPKEMHFTVPNSAVFPTEHMRRIIAAAREGKSVLEFPVYDGSESGEKLYNTLTVIGHPIEPGNKAPDDASAKIPALAKLARWPVTISYFDKSEKKSEQSGEETPVYSISFELYENGISRSLILDYTDFTISGEMTSLEMKNSKPCP